MAAIFIIAGGVFGFASALASVMLLETGVLAALAIWSGVGIFFAAAGLFAALLPRPAGALGKETNGVASPLA